MYSNFQCNFPTPNNNPSSSNHKKLIFVIPHLRIKVKVTPHRPNLYHTRRIYFFFTASHRTEQLLFNKVPGIEKGAAIWLIKRSRCTRNPFLLASRPFSSPNVSTWRAAKTASTRKRNEGLNGLAEKELLPHNFACLLSL